MKLPRIMTMRNQKMPQQMPPQAQGTPQGGPPQGMPPQAQGMPMGGPPQGMPPQAQGDPMKRQQMMANMMRGGPNNG